MEREPELPCPFWQFWQLEPDLSFQLQARFPLLSTILLYKVLHVPHSLTHCSAHEATCALYRIRKVQCSVRLFTVCFATLNLIITVREQFARKVCVQQLILIRTSTSMCSDVF